MGENIDWATVFKNYESTFQRICSGTTALSAIVNGTTWDKFDLIDKKTSAIFNGAQNLILKMDRYTPATITTLEKMSQLGKSLLSGYVSATRLIENSAIFDGIAKLGCAMVAKTPGMISAVDQLSKVLKAYQIPDISLHMEHTLSQWSSFDPDILQAASSFDLSDIEISDSGEIVYDGREYAAEEIPAILDSQIELAKKPTLRERFENLRQRYWLLFFILGLLMSLPEIPEKVEFYCDIVAQIQDVCEEKSQICFTIKESSVLREEASSKSARIMELPYDTPLEILEDVPRWYQVKYTDDDGIETIGWISKISVETED